ncbi:alpha/beta fold hydrolase [Achromobacter sp. PD1]|uniref:alpha/beta fold hydrolase n=1 Tax=Achromobacter sp. PD1 TaxID=3399125 RepID=UPI003AF87E2F
MKANKKTAPKPATGQTMSVDDAFGVAARAWHENRQADAAQICRQIQAIRPEHQGVKHLNLTLQHGVRGLVFTALGLVDPDIYSVGDFSYGVPSVFPHNQPHEPARLSIGNFCTIGHHVEIILGAYHRQDTYTIYPFSAPHFGTLFASTQSIADYSTTRGGVTIGHDVWIGAGAKIMSGVTIGTGAVIGAGSVVSRDVGSYEIWAGNPAQFRRRRFDVAVSDRLMRARWWDWPKDLIERYARDIMHGTPEALEALEQGHEEWLTRLSAQVTAPFEALRGHSGLIRARRSAGWREGRATWIVLHGSLGSIATVQGFESHLPDANLLFVDMPGCGASTAPLDMSVNGFVDELLPALLAAAPSGFGMLGVSFGGSVSLEIARRTPLCKQVVLLDTPFSAAKLWHNHAFLRGAIAARPDDRYLRSFALEIYGVTPTAAVERDYWSLMDGVVQSVTVVTGNVSMQPPRQMPPVPCCLDEDDLMRLDALGCRLERIPGGHDLINDSPAAVAAVLRSVQL